MGLVKQKQKRLARIFSGQSGSVAVEFAISLMVIMTLIFATIELCSGVYTYVVLSGAANEGLRYAIVHSSDGANLVANTTSKVTACAAFSMHDVSAISVSVSFPDGSVLPPHRVSVSVSYAYLPYLDIVIPSPPTMTAFAVGRMVY